MMPCAPSVRSRAHLYGSAFLAISPLLKRPGLVPFLLLSTCESGEAGLKNCPAGDARLKVKEMKEGNQVGCSRAASCSALFSHAAAGDIINSYLFYFPFFGSRREDCPCFPRWQKSNVLLLLFLLPPAVKLTFNVTFDLRTNTVRQIWG